MSKLALVGGDRVIPKGTRPPVWPVVTEAEHDAVLEVLHSRKFTAAAAGEQQIGALEREWAARTGSRHCVAVANGTVAMSIGLAAAGVRSGDEVVVPALSFVGTALAPAHLGAVPVFADVDPVTFNLDPKALEEVVSERTVAVLPVHLHGLPADMDEILAVAGRRGLTVVEDSAQAHGVAYRGRTTGAIGDAGAFSLNVSKNLPTCGEGGLLTTDDDELAGRARLMRQFGERIPDRGERPYVSELLGWNAKINAIQAAFTRRQLTRLDVYNSARDRNVRAFLRAVSELPGFVVPTAPDDREHGWHILRFRVRPEAFDLSGDHAERLRAVIGRVLRAEGVPVSRYQTMPLPEQPAFRGTTYRAGEMSMTRAVVQDSFVLQRVHLNPESGPMLALVAAAFAKVWENRDLVAHIVLSGRPTEG